MKCLTPPIPQQDSVAGRCTLARTLQYAFARFNSRTDNWPVVWVNSFLRAQLQEKPINQAVTRSNRIKQEKRHDWLTRDNSCVNTALVALWWITVSAIHLEIESVPPQGKAQQFWGKYTMWGAVCRAIDVAPTIRCNEFHDGRDVIAHVGFNPFSHKFFANLQRSCIDCISPKWTWIIHWQRLDYQQENLAYTIVAVPSALWSDDDKAAFALKKLSSMLSSL